MIVTIPTYGRALNQRTWKNLPPDIQKVAVLVVQEREAHLYKDRGFNYYVLPPGVEDIASTRDVILNFHNHESVLMLDDDLDFAIRREDDKTRFRPATCDELSFMFARLSDLLKIYAHVGVSPREGANRRTDDLLFIGRSMRVIGYNASEVKKHRLLFGSVPYMEDFHMTLSLLRLGYQNCIVNSFVHNQPGSQQPGGCSGTRTPERQTEAAEMLAAIHYPFVKVIKKVTKQWERTDVRIQWRQAYESSKTRVLDDRTGQDTATEGGGGPKALEH